VNEAWFYSMEFLDYAQYEPVEVGAYQDGWFVVCPYSCSCFEKVSFTASVRWLVGQTYQYCHELNTSLTLQLKEVKDELSRVLLF
jgi:hypothetical protein